MDCTRESPELTLKSILGAAVFKIMDEVGSKWKMVALLQEEEDREQRGGGGKCWEEEKESGKAIFAGPSQVK